MSIGSDVVCRYDCVHDVGLKGTLLRVPRAIARDGVSATAARTTRAIWRSLVYAHDEVLVFRHGAGEAFVVPDGDLGGPNLPVLPLEMALARKAAARHPEVLTPSIIRLFDDSLRAGERGFMVVRDGALAHYSWMGIRTEIVTTEIGEPCRVRLEQPAALIYHCWTAPEARGAGIYPFVLRRVCRLAEKEGLDTWIYCEPGNRASIAGIQKAGFVPVHHFHRRRLLGFLEFHSVAKADA